MRIVFPKIAEYFKEYWFLDLIRHGIGRIMHNDYVTKEDYGLIQPKIENTSSKNGNQGEGIGIGKAIFNTLTLG